MIKKKCLKTILAGLVCCYIFLICCSNNNQKKQGSFYLATEADDSGLSLTNIKAPVENEKISNGPVIVPGKSVLSKIKDDKVEGHNIIKDLPYGYVKNGTVDYTKIIQAALDKYDKLVFPAFPILINDKGLNIPSNRTLTFLENAELVLKPSAKKMYNILNLRQVSNVKIINPTIKGDRYSHLGTEGEYGMGIAIRGGKNIRIYNARITECWGDGIYIGQAGREVPEDIIIKDAFLKKNRRDGISIISVNGLVLDNIYAAYTDGTKPMCGINFETNNPFCEIKNVKVINPRTEYNKGSGIQVGIRTMLGGSTKTVDIKIINHVDVSSTSSALKVACNRKTGTVGGSVNGVIKVVNPSWTSTISGKPLVFTTDQTNLKVRVSKARIKDKKGIILGSLETNRLLNKHSIGDFEYSTD